MSRGGLRSLKANSGCAGVLLFSFFGPDDIVSVLSSVHSVVSAFDRIIWLFLFILTSELPCSSSARGPRGISQGKKANSVALLPCSI